MNKKRQIQLEELNFPDVDHDYDVYLPHDDEYISNFEEDYVQNFNQDMDEEEVEDLRGIAGKDFERKRNQLDLQDKKSDLGYKRKTFCHVRRIVRRWLVFLGVIVFLDAVTLNVKWMGWVSFDIDSEVLMVLLGSSTAAIVGLYAVITRYLFPNNGENNNE